MKKPSKILYFGKKTLAFLLSVLVLSLAVFYVSRLAPGDPLVSYYGDRAEKLTPQERAQAEEKLGLDEPIFTQYVRWAQNALHVDFGISYKYKMPAAEVIASRAGNTLLLGGIGFVLIFTLSLLLGMLFIFMTFLLNSVVMFFVGLFFVLLAIVMFIVGLVLKR